MHKEQRAKRHRQAVSVLSFVMPVVYREYVKNYRLDRWRQQTQHSSTAPTSRQQGSISIRSVGPAHFHES